MKKLLKNKKLLIGLSLLLLIIIIAIIVITLKPKEENRALKEVTNNYIAYISINPSLKLEYTQTCKKDGKIEIECSDPTVTSYELLNDDAKEIYKNTNLLDNDKELLTVINLIISKAKENNIEFDTINIYSDWKQLDDFINSSESPKEFTFNIIINDKNNLTNVEDALINNLTTYTVTFDTNGGNEIVSQTIKENETAVQPDIPKKNGYTFIEWQLNEEAFDFETPITSDIILTAKWEKNKASNNNTNENNTTENNANNSNSNEETQNNNPVEKAYLYFSDLYSLERIKEIEQEYNIKINLIADTSCGYIEGGDPQLIESGKTYNVHVASLDPYIQGGCGDSGQGDAGEIDYCAEDPNSTECVYQKFGYFTKSENGKSINGTTYDGKEIFRSEVFALKLCYDEYSCLNKTRVQIFKYDKSTIQSLSQKQKEYIRVSINDTLLSQVQKDYNTVISHNYIEQYQNNVSMLEELLIKYADYKEVDIIPEDQVTCPPGFGCFNAYNYIESELEWQLNYLEDAQSDVKNINDALQSLKEFLTLLK